VVTGRRRTAAHRIEVDDGQLRHSSVVRGPVAVVHPVIRATGVPWQYSSPHRGYLVPRAKADIVIAALERAGHAVEWKCGATLW
jgi:hypothetical protein